MLKVRSNAIEQDEGPFIFPGLEVDGLVVIGAGSALSAYALEIVTEGVQGRQLEIYGYNPSANPYPGSTFYSARGTRDAPSAVQSGDWIGSFNFRGYGASAFQNTESYIAAIATQDFTDAVGGTRLEFGVTLTGTLPPGGRIVALSLGDENVINESGDSVNTRIETDNLDDGLFINAAENAIYLGGQSGAPGDGSTHLNLQAQATGGSLVAYATGIEMGDLEGKRSQSGGFVDFIDYYNSGSAGFGAWFMPISLNAYWDVSVDGWRFVDSNYPAIVNQQYVRYDTANPIANWNVGFFAANPGGVPPGFISWMVGVQNNLTVGNAEVTFNDDGIDMDFRVESDSHDASLFVEGSSGFVGVGHRAPYDPLVVGDGAGGIYANPAISVRSGTGERGTITFADGDTAPASYAGWIDYDHSTDFMSIATAATEALRIEADGGIFLPLIPGGAVAATASISASKELFYVTSSERFKKDIRPLEVDTSLVYLLEPKSFAWNEGTATPNQDDFGLIAEDVYKIMPELVGLDKDGKPWTVKYGMLGVILLSEIAKLNDRVSALETT